MLCSEIKIDIFTVPSSENNILIFYNSQMEQGNNPRLGSLMTRSDDSDSDDKLLEPGKSSFSLMMYG